MTLHSRAFRAPPCPTDPGQVPRARSDCPRIAERMAPDPGAVLTAFQDLGLTLAETARYFDIPLPCLVHHLASENAPGRPTRAA